MVFSRGQAGYLVSRSPWAPVPRPLTLRNDRQGLYSYDPYMEEDLTSFAKKGPYSFWSSVKYILILSVMLWWIPTFGQMIAGYVGGRKAGKHWKAAAAALFPVALIWTFSLIVQASGTFPQLANLLALPAMAAYGVGQALPVFDPYIRFTVDYLISFAVALKETVSMGLNGYLVTIIFAYIGGLIADQTSKERSQPSREEFVDREAAFGYDTRFPPFEPPMTRYRPALASVPSGWYRVHRERFDHLRRIPVAPSGYEEEMEDYYEPVRRPVQRRVDEGYPPEDVYDRAQELEPIREPLPRRRPRRLDKEELIRRLVERALREYDRSVG